MANAFISPFVRASYPNLFEAQKAKNFPDSKPTFSLNMIAMDQLPIYESAGRRGDIIAPEGTPAEAWTQDQKDYAKDPTMFVRIRRALKAACVETWKEDRTKWQVVDQALNFQGLNFGTYLDFSGKAFPLVDAALKPGRKMPPGFENAVFAIGRAKEEYPPKVFKLGSKTALTVKEKGEVYGGLIVRVQLRPYAWGDGKGCGLGLLMVQIIRDDGVRFGGGGGNVDDFGAFGDPSMMDDSGFEGNGTTVQEYEEL